MADIYGKKMDTSINKTIIVYTEKMTYISTHFKYFSDDEKHLKCIDISGKKWILQ